VSDVSSEIYQAVREVIARRSYDRAMAATSLCERLLHNEGAITRQEDEILVGERRLSLDRELLTRMAQSTGLGFAIYAGNRRIAVATVLDAGTPPELNEFAPSDLVDRVLRRREVFKGNVYYRDREYISVCRPLHASGGQDFAPIGMIEAFQDKEAYFDLLAAAARTGVEDQVADLEERADGMEDIIHFIDDVARRLQLLALNGNIIAAQAGEHGRAFRVVCRELGSLADQAKQTAGDVRKLIQAMGLERDDTAYMNQLESLAQQAPAPEPEPAPMPTTASRRSSASTPSRQAPTERASAPDRAPERPDRPDRADRLDRGAPTGRGAAPAGRPTAQSGRSPAPPAPSRGRTTRR
jgi:hypothetical protein